MSRKAPCPCPRDLWKPILLACDSPAFDSPDFDSTAQAVYGGGRRRSLRLARLAGPGPRRRLPLRGEVRQQRGQALPLLRGVQGGQHGAEADVELLQVVQATQPHRQLWYIKPFAGSDPYHQNHLLDFDAAWSC